VPNRRLRIKTRRRHCYYDPQQLPQAVPYRLGLWKLYRIDGVPGLFQIRRPRKNLRVEPDCNSPVARVIDTNGVERAAHFDEHVEMTAFVHKALGWALPKTDQWLLCGSCGEPAQYGIGYRDEIVCHLCLGAMGAKK
jgi:hypothetical protein